MADDAADTPSLTDLQHWTWVMGRAQQMMMEQGIAALRGGGLPVLPGLADPAAVQRATDFWTDGLALWQRLVDPASADAAAEPAALARDKRF